MVLIVRLEIYLVFKIHELDEVICSTYGFTSLPFCPSDLWDAALLLKVKLKERHRKI